MGYERKITTLYRQSAGKVSDKLVGEILEDSRETRIYDIVRTATINKIAEAIRNDCPPS
jgi:hypothetical protein